MNDLKQKNEERAINFCQYCGTKLDKGARFCKNCGESIGDNQKNNIKKNETETNDNITERKAVYEGYIHKCPNCGEVMKSFSTNCTACGHEIRNTKSSTSVREFAQKLEKIESQKMPDFQEKESIMKKVFGKDFNDEDELEEAQDRFEEQKNNEKINIIINYSVPNTKEDILEFMLLASSNVKDKGGTDDEISKAWLSKMEQVHQKAEILFDKDDETLNKINLIYTHKKEQIKKHKIKTVKIVIGCILGYVLLFSLLFFIGD